MTKEELIAKYWKKSLPGNEGRFNSQLIKRNWKKDKDNQKIKEKDLEDLLNEVNG